MKPSNKSKPLDEAIKEVFGFDRKAAISKLKCAPPPYGCGGDVDLSELTGVQTKEYSISSMCKVCQEAFFD